MVWTQCGFVAWQASPSFSFVLVRGEHRQHESSRLDTTFPTFLSAAPWAISGGWVMVASAGRHANNTAAIGGKLRRECSRASACNDADVGKVRWGRQGKPFPGTGLYLRENT
ncbi:uncharacterized protein LY79DRAFT_547269 [Colletotrichum navitas]|uniref:Uncharacterized protein n=1 Tax=Colletotrichum navitas TaxID=681940 RepID=A0AAD8Q3K0_9PEZI|nr:uncharacterized protein LY79DRAFT_547269 [Colletotrichum navitas]KAK1595291.1 hypothetical protein LY79DRAFT_547269 [Colletotrichum navitas]